MDGPVVSPLGDRAILVTLSQEISEETNELVQKASREIEGASIPGVQEVQPAYSSFCVHFDPSRVSASWLGAYALQTVGRIASGRETPAGDVRSVSPREVLIPVKYGGKDGPDLEWASGYLGMTKDEIIRRHAKPTYKVYMIGFLPGFPYLGGLDPELSMPRTPAPRASVPPGSVGIAGRQTGIYPWESPGGWRIIGRTSLVLFDPYREDPSLLHPGDAVRFVPVEELENPPQVPATGKEKCRPSVPAFEVERPGLFSIVVDGGRRGFRKLGVPLSGAADSRSYALANILCGNNPAAPALEMTLWGARIRALVDVVVAVTGAPCPVEVDGRPVSMDEPVRVRAGSVVDVGSPPCGCRMYMAVSGGFSVPEVLGSASTYARGSFGGYRGRPIRQGDVLEVGPGPSLAGDTGAISDVPVPLKYWPATLARFLGEKPHVLRVIPGPEALTQEGKKAFQDLSGQVFVVRNDSDRMGIRFEGRITGEYGGGDILSSPVVPGVVQLPSDGSPVLLLHDAQTSGGYRRIAAVVSDDLSLAAQLRPGCRVRFITA